MWLKLVKTLENNVVDIINQNIKDFNSSYTNIKNKVDINKKY